MRWCILIAFGVALVLLSTILVTAVPAYVQSGYGECYPATSCDVDFGVPGIPGMDVKEGSLLVMTTRTDNNVGNEVQSVTSVPACTWARDVQQFSSTGFWIEVWSCPKAPAGDYTVTVKVGSPEDQMRIILTEYSGIAASGHIDGMPVSDTHIESACSDAGFITTSLPNSLIHAVGAANGNDDAYTFTPGEGYTVHDLGGDPRGSDKTMTQHRVAVTPGTYNTEMCNINDDCAGVAVAYASLDSYQTDSTGNECGDGNLDIFEHCDDGNNVNGDGCSSICQAEGDDFPVIAYSGNVPVPALEDLPLLGELTQHGITWTFEEPARVGRFVNGDYYVVGSVTVADIDPLPSNGRHGSQLNIPPNVQRSGFDNRISSGRYDASLRVDLPVSLAPGNSLVSSRSASTDQACVLRPISTSSSPVASVSILTSVSAPQPLDAFRPSYAVGQNTIYLSRNINRQILPRLQGVAHTAPITEFEAYLKRPWIDTVFFNFAVPAEYMACYGRENGYMMSFAGLLLTLDMPQEEKEPLLVYMVQYGIDLYGLVQAGHSGWNAHGGHGTGRKFPILLAGVMLDNAGMKSLDADFGEDMQTIWVNETLPPGSYQHTWHSIPQVVAYGGHYGVNGESVNQGWGPYEHLSPAQWPTTTDGTYLGNSYRRCCTSVAWVGEALAARLIPGMMESWDHPQFFAYVDRWMTPEDPDDIQRIKSETGLTVSGDFMQGHAGKILSGGGYYEPHNVFIDEMWEAYRDVPLCGDGICDPDEDCPVDCCMTLSGLSDVIVKWKNGIIEIDQVMEVIIQWKSGC